MASEANDKDQHWSVAEAMAIWAEMGFVKDRLGHTSIIARALVAAERRGIERAAEVADAVAQDSGERAARGYFTTEEQARRGAGRAISASIRKLGDAP